jgi:phthiocerol/phenolphthiocerol synthesis type-I polyketide synthase C
MLSDQKSIAGAQKVKPDGQLRTQTPLAIEEWLVSYLSAKLQKEPSEIDKCKSLSYYGLCSTEAVTLAGDLESYLGRTLSATLTWNYPSIEKIANYLGSDAPPAETACDSYQQALDGMVACAPKRENDVLGGEQ